MIPVGIVYFLLYYFIFSFLIKKFDFKTPGREDDDTETKLYTKADVNARKAAKDTKASDDKAVVDELADYITRSRRQSQYLRCGLLCDKASYHSNRP